MKAPFPTSCRFPLLLLIQVFNRAFILIQDGGLDPAEEGTGMSIEISGDRLFLAWYLFDETTGDSMWFTAGGTMSSPDSFSGIIYSWENMSFGDASIPPESSHFGSIEIQFYSSDSAEVLWSTADHHDSKLFRKFMNYISEGALDSRDLHGWWYFPDIPGTGLFMEARNNRIFIAWYHYRDAGTPLWWSTGGDFPEGAITLPRCLKRMA